MADARQQFNLDEPGEALLVHKGSAAMGGDFPLCMTGGHTRWRIDTIWRSEPNLLRLQRGEPG